MIKGLHPVVQALLASLFTWAMTALGAAVVVVLPPNNKKVLDASLGFAAGVMTAASFWSLLAPAIAMAETAMGAWAFVTAAVGFCLGAAFVYCADRLLTACGLTDASAVAMMQRQSVQPQLHAADLLPLPSSLNGTADKLVIEEKNGGTEMRHQLAISWGRIFLLIIAVTVHNIPEGLAVGVGFGSVGKGDHASFQSAFNLALGIGLQNFPEGLAVSLPLVGFGYTKARAFIYGQLSGMVEPMAAVVGAAVVLVMEPVLPYALAFAAGAMIYVVVDDIIPEAQRNGNGKLASLGAIVGFTVMMCLDVGLG